MELNSIEAIKDTVQSGLSFDFVSILTNYNELKMNTIYCTKIGNITIDRKL